MKVLHTIADLSRHSGGTSTCTYELVKALNHAGCSADILTLAAKDDNDSLIGSESFIHAVNGKYHTPFYYSPEMRRAIRDAANYQVFHINGLWLDINNYTGKIARECRIPYVVSPHGMLYPQALAMKPIRKRLMRFLCFDRLLRNAACIHATCEEELQHYRALGFRNPVAVIPNLLPIPKTSPVCQHNSTIRRIGFLGRFHPIKNIPGLLEAWRLLGTETRDAELLLIGGGMPDYEDELKKLAASLPEQNIHFCGFIQGEDKYRLLSSLSALCVPSFQENFGMTVLEAWLVNVPVIATQTTPWQELETHHCGWWVKNDPPALAKAIHQVLTLSDAELAERGKNGNRLLQQKYSPERVTTQMYSLYQWISGHEEKPDFVQVMK